MYDFGMTVAARYGRTREETEEIANDAFYKMLKHIDRYRSETPFKLWLRRIIINCGIDHYRKFQTKSASNNVPRQLVLSNAVAEQTEQAFLLSLVRQLPESYRMVFILHVVEGYSHAEIAQQLGINKGTSKSNLAKARRKLQSMLARNNKSMQAYGGQTIRYAV